MTNPAPGPVHPALSGTAFLLAFVAAALFALTSRYPGYVHHDTAEIAMWSTLGWPAGLPKHPPFLPWLFRSLSYLMPLNWISLSLLTAANIALGAWAVWAIARRVLDEPRSALAALLYGLAPAGTFFALKLNHNAILVSLWPLIILAFLACMDARSWKASVLSGIAFGALAAAGMLAKYYTGVLLASCVIAALVSRDRSRFMTSPGGYVAVVVFAALMTPHALWMLHDGGASTLDYALHETEAENRLLGHFLILTPVYLLPPLLGFYALRHWLGPAHPGKNACPRLPELIVLAAGPFAMTAVLIEAFGLRGATSWTLPDFAVVPVLLAGALAVPSASALAGLKRIAGALLVGIALLGPVVLMAAFMAGDANTVEPRAEVAGIAATIFRQATGRAPTLIAGDPQSATSASLVLPGHPLVFSSFDPAVAPWVTPEILAKGGLLVICRPHTGCDERTEKARFGQPAFTCNVTRNRRWLWLTGRPLTVKVTVIPPAGAALNETAATAACSH